MAMHSATLRSEGKGKYRVVDSREGKGVSEPLDFDAAIALLNASNAEIMAEAAASASRPASSASLRVKLTYRNEIQFIPAGESFAAITATQDKMDRLIADWPSIVATFEANRSQVAKTYADRPKSNGKDGEKPKKDLQVVVKA